MPTDNKIIGKKVHIAKLEREPVVVEKADVTEAPITTAKPAVFDANAGALSTKDVLNKPSGAASTTAQIAALRSSTLHKKPDVVGEATTAASRMATMGGVLKSMSKWKKAVITAVFGAALMTGMMANPLNLGAQTVYVNVNGATQQMAEYRGAEQAAREHREPFINVRPANLESVLQDVESGKTTLRKLVPSGHSSGLWFSGTDEQGSNSLSFDQMKTYSTQYPNAFKQVQYFYAMACNVGTEENSRQWMELFPNAHALIGFDHIAPASTRPAAQTVLVEVDRVLSQVNWKKLTRADALALAVRISKMPGVNVTEFAIRIRANDGTTVYFSKVNKPTTTTAAQDLSAQLRASTFAPYFEATDPAFAHPPRDVAQLRAFYNAQQSLMNVLGRDLRATNVEPSTNAAYQTAVHEKEATLKLIDFDNILGNAEFHMRGQMDAAVKELAERGIAVSIPNLSTLKRAQIIEIANQLKEVGPYALVDFKANNAADITMVEAFLAPNSAYRGGNGTFGDLHQAASADAITLAQELVKQMQADPAAPAEVKDAAGRLGEALKTTRSPAVEQVRTLFVDGLKDLKSGVYPEHWITTVRRG